MSQTGEPNDLPSQLQGKCRRSPGFGEQFGITHMLAALVLEACTIYRNNNDGKPGNDYCMPEGDTQEAKLTDYFADVGGRVAKSKHGYKADMLHGIWARAPYLHNGSIPTLGALICPPARPTVFKRGNITYDQNMVGFEWQNIPATRYNSNTKRS